MAKTTLGGDEPTPITCSPSDARFAEASLIPNEPPFGLAPRNSVVNADESLASINLKELRPAENRVYLLQVTSGETQTVLGFFTPLEKIEQSGEPLDYLLESPEQTELRLIELDSSQFTMTQISASENIAPCVD